MNIFNNLTTYIRQFDEQERLKYMSIIIGILILSVGIFLYRFSSITSTLRKRLQHINNQRIEAGPILVRYAHVVQQRQHVDKLLQADPNFRIIEFITTTCQALNLTSHLTKNPEITTQSALDGHTEQKSTCQLHELTMQQIVNLLDKIEQNERVYTKEIHISRSTSSSSLLDLTIDIATFEAKESAT